MHGVGLTLSQPDTEFLQGDFRQLVHELDEAEYRDIRLMVMEIRNAYVRRQGQGWAEAPFSGYPLSNLAGWGWKITKLSLSTRLEMGHRITVGLCLTPTPSWPYRLYCMISS